MAAKLRAHNAGKLRIEPTGLLPVDPETGLHFAGFSDNWWIGLAMLHTLFTLEHNYICDLLAHEDSRREADGRLMPTASHPLRPATATEKVLLASLGLELPFGSLTTVLTPLTPSVIRRTWPELAP